MSYTAHQDTFAGDNLPPRDQWPEMIFEIPEVQYPERLNCAVELLDRHVQIETTILSHMSNHACIANLFKLLHLHNCNFSHFTERVQEFLKRL